MKFQLQIISLKFFFAFIIVGILLSIVGVVLFARMMNAVVSLILFPGFPFLFFFLAHFFARKNLDVLINEDSVVFDNEEIKFEEIEGFFEDPNFTMNGFSIKLKSGRIRHIIGFYRGDARVNFDNFTRVLVRKMKSLGSIKPLTFLDVHPRQRIPNKPFFWFVIIFNVAAIVAMIILEKFSPKIFLFNIFALGMMPYLSRNKKSKTGTSGK